VIAAKQLSARGTAASIHSRSGVPIWIDRSARSAHAKTMVIDGEVTLMGSYNWTAGSAVTPRI
jgi:phosphatidylserine/phosphatidylglycerophosphate/cardiolipin synthase-like enzyme